VIALFCIVFGWALILTATRRDPIIIAVSILLHLRAGYMLAWEVAALACREFRARYYLAVDDARRGALYD
jgi:hypothetical protein